MKHQKAIALIEVLVTAGLTSVIALLIANAYISGIQSWDFNFSRYSASSNLDNAVNSIAQYALLASSSADTFNYNGIIYSSDSDTLILQVPSIAASGAVINGYFDSLVYDFDSPNKNLKELIVPDTHSYRNFKDKIIVENVAAVSFAQTETAKGKMQIINLTINSASLGKTTRYSLSRSIRMRNQL